MKRILFIVTAVLTAIVSVNAQDFIYQRHQGSRIAASNIDVLSNETTYKMYGDDSEEIYSIDNNKISLIAFENGEVRFFERQEKAARRFNYNKNMINYHLFDLIVNNFKISYERIISNGKIGIQIPVSIGYGNYGNTSGFDNVYDKFYTGVSINFYPTGQGKVRYFMGPGIQIGTGFFDDYYYGQYDSYRKKTDTFVFRFLVNNGIIFTPIDALSISLVGSLGIRYTDKIHQYDNSNIITVGAFSANLSYRF